MPFSDAFANTFSAVYGALRDVAETKRIVIDHEMRMASAKEMAGAWNGPDLMRSRRLVAMTNERLQGALEAKPGTHTEAELKEFERSNVMANIQLMQVYTNKMMNLGTRSQNPYTRQNAMQAAGQMMQGFQQLAGYMQATRQDVQQSVENALRKFDITERSRIAEMGILTDKELEESRQRIMEKGVTLEAEARFRQISVQELQTELNRYLGELEHGDRLRAIQSQERMHDVAMHNELLSIYKTHDIAQQEHNLRERQFSLAVEEWKAGGPLRDTELLMSVSELAQFAEQWGASVPEIRSTVDKLLSSTGMTADDVINLSRATEENVRADIKELDTSIAFAEQVNDIASIKAYQSEKEFLINKLNRITRARVESAQRMRAAGPSRTEAFGNAVARFREKIPLPGIETMWELGGVFLKATGVLGPDNPDIAVLEKEMENQRGRPSPSR